MFIFVLSVFLTVCLLIRTFRYNSNSIRYNKHIQMEKMLADHVPGKQDDTKAIEIN